MRQKTLYGQLQRLLVIKLLQPTPLPLPLRDDPPSHIVLAFIQNCKIDDTTNPISGSLDIHHCTQMGALDVVDINTIDCVVGRVKDRGRFSIIDRSGSLSRSFYGEDDDE